MYPSSQGFITVTCFFNLHHEAVDVWFSADTVQWGILPLHAAAPWPWRRLIVRHITVLKGPKRNQTTYYEFQSEKLWLTHT